MRKIIKQILYSNSVLHGELVTAWDVHAVRKRNMQNLWDLSKVYDKDTGTAVTIYFGVFIGNFEQFFLIEEIFNSDFEHVFTNQVMSCKWKNVIAGIGSENWQTNKNIEGKASLWKSRLNHEVAAL